MSSDYANLEIDPGRHDRSGCPIIVTQDVGLAGRNGDLVGENGLEIPVQSLADGSAALILDQGYSGQRAKRYSLRSRLLASVNSGTGMRVINDGDETLSVFQNDDLITKYCYGNGYARPFFFPVNEPAGRCVTRSYPMQSIPG